MAGRSGLAGSAAVMFSGTLVSRFLGVLRNALLVAAIGVTGSDAANAFSVANKLPNIIYMLLAGGILNAVLVPQIVRAMRKDDGGTEYVNRLLTLAATVMGLITLALTAASGLLITIYAEALRDGPWMPLAVAFAMWCIPQLFFYGLYTLLGQLLNARSSFGPYMWAPVLNNIISIAGLVAYLIVYGSFATDPASVADWDAQRIALLAGPWTIGVAMQAFILVVPLYRSGFRYRPTWGLRNTGLRSAGRVAMWAFAALAVGQIGYLAISNLAAAAGTRSDALPDPASVAGNAAYDNAFLIFMLPQSLITVSLVTAMFTRLSEHAAGGRTFRVRDDLSRGLRTLAVFTVFAAGAFMVLAIPLTQLVTFDQADFSSYRAVGHVLVAMLVGLPAIAIWTMAQRVYFAFEDARSLFWIQVPMAGIQIIGSVVAFLTLEVQWWVVGAGAATAISNTFGALVAYLALRRKLPTLDGARVLRTHLRVLLAVIPTTLLGWGALHLWGVQTSFMGALLRVLVIGGAMGLGYLVLLRRLRVSELDVLLERVGGMLSPLTRRLQPVATRLKISGPLRTMWTSIVGGEGIGGTSVTHGTTATLEPGATLADRYVLQGPLPTDLPETSVWSGHDEILQREVLLTVVQGAHREEALDAARRAALITDPRLRRIMRVGSHDGTGFVVSDPTPARSLADLVSEGRLPAPQARALVGEAAAALELSRKRGVHHLHLRPTALRVTDSGEVQLCGLAVDAAQAGITSTDSRRSARADAIDLVALLYTALTGYWPGAPERAGALPAAPRKDGAPIPPGDLVDDVPHDLDTLCAVTFGPHEDGPFTAGELVRELEPWDGIGSVTPVTGPTTPAVGDQSDDEADDDDVAPGEQAPESNAASAAGVSPDDEVTASSESATASEPGAAPVPDSSGWHPHPPPADRGPVSFSTVLEPGEEAPAPGYLARHVSGGSTVLPTPGRGIAGREAATAPAEPPSDQQPRNEAGSDPTSPEATSVLPAARPDQRVPEEAPSSEPDGPAQATAPEAAAVPPARRPLPPTLGWDDPTGTSDRPAPPTAPARPAVTAAGVGTALTGILAGVGARIKAGVRSRLVRETEGEDGPQERFNPTPIVIFVMVSVVVVATILAIGSLRDASTAFDPGEYTREPTPTATEPSEEPSEEPTTPEPTEEPTPEPTRQAAIDIDEGRSLDPSTGVGDNENLARFAVDGDPETTWDSLRYDNPEYGMKDGLGYAVVLSQTATVTSVTVDVQGAGGVLQIRSTEPDDPSGGEVLAEGEMGPETTYELSTPTELDTIVLWFPELPVAESDGRNRIELAEITVN
ncbi:murein biosynthesis integral membrane protein MurJ [Ruania alba]|uniref:Murein biosynthesis integral membrane protein MurJ n=1 Tax=Ruania alba TaxID=648782 RepID=A0A1H5LHM1_9MICO|nr:murein biosynthesis integral membrane protein MurJ [Ruania alba]SEE76489.1 murein biosynthesis integral membrane protein MurJ [Ruania alba]